MAPLDMFDGHGAHATLGKEMLELVERSPLDIITSTFENDRVRALMLYTTLHVGTRTRRRPASASSFRCSSIVA